MVTFLHGALFMACLVASVFFWRYWQATRDRLFVCFSAAFVVLGVHWAWFGLEADDPRRPEVYILRLVAFLIIIAGIVDKNRRESDL